jgi:hypothetical protein
MSTTSMQAELPSVTRLAIATKSWRYACMVCAEGLRVWRSCRNAVNQSGNETASFASASASTGCDGCAGLLLSGTLPR